jgi:hypothetical protein
MPPAAGELPQRPAGSALLPTRRDAATALVGRFVGLFCQPASGLERFAAVARTDRSSVKIPVNTGLLLEQRDAGGGTRTPDTRIMIPLL